MKRIINPLAIVEVTLVKERPSINVVWTNESKCWGGFMGCSIKKKKHEWAWVYRPNTVDNYKYESDEELLKEYSYSRIETTSATVRNFILPAYVNIELSNGKGIKRLYPSDDEAEKFYKEVLSLLPQKILVLDE